MSRTAQSRLHSVPGGRTLEPARRELGEFIIGQARKTRGEVGFGYAPSDEAPSSYADLQRAFANSVQTGQPLPVSTAHCESVIFTSPSINHALRFWRDVCHVRSGLTFDVVDELELAMWQLGVLEDAGHRPNSLVWKLLHADLVGAVYCMALGQRFPVDRRRFAERCLERGFDLGLLLELRQED